VTADFLVTFSPVARNDHAAFADLKEALEYLLGRSVDLVERESSPMTGACRDLLHAV
jgi:predicted nucleotidyltransferase